MNATLTLTHTLTGTHTNAIANTYIHTNITYRKMFVDKALQRHFVQNSIRNIGPDDSVDFKHIGYPPTLPGWLAPAGEKPFISGVAYSRILKNLTDLNVANYRHSLGTGLLFKRDYRSL